MFAGVFQSTWNCHTPIVSASNRLASCTPPAAIMMFGAPGGGAAVPSTSALFRKPTSFMTTHCSVAGSPLSIRARSATHACFWVAMVSEIGLSPVLVGT